MGGDLVEMENKAESSRETDIRLVFGHQKSFLHSIQQFVTAGTIWFSVVLVGLANWIQCNFPFNAFS